jgi:antitoxin component of MazEF toxin-antitoxin module
LPVEFKVKLRRVGKSLVVSVPRPAVDGLKWREGDELRLVVIDGEVALRNDRTSK